MVTTDTLLLPLGKDAVDSCNVCMVCCWPLFFPCCREAMSFLFVPCAGTVTGNPTNKNQPNNSVIVWGPGKPGKGVLLTFMFLSLLTSLLLLSFFKLHGCDMGSFASCGRVGICFRDLIFLRWFLGSTTCYQYFPLPKSRLLEEVKLKNRAAERLG